MKPERKVKDYLLFCEAWLLMAIARLMLVFLPFKKIIPVLGKLKNENKDELPAGDNLLRSIKISIERASRYSPWRTKCFEQALTGKMMLKRRHITSTIFFGVNKDEHNKLNAHAWLKTDDKTITGGNNLERYTILGSFKS